MGRGERWSERRVRKPLPDFTQYGGEPGGDTNFIGKMAYVDLNKFMFSKKITQIS